MAKLLTIETAGGCFAVSAVRKGLLTKWGIPTNKLNVFVLLSK